jgi:hypothetical protein
MKLAVLAVLSLVPLLFIGCGSPGGKPKPQFKNGGWNESHPAESFYFGPPVKKRDLPAGQDKP